MSRASSTIPTIRHVLLMVEAIGYILAELDRVHDDCERTYATPEGIDGSAIGASPLQLRRKGGSLMSAVSSAIIVRDEGGQPRYMARAAPLEPDTIVRDREDRLMVASYDEPSMTERPQRKNLKTSDETLSFPKGSANTMRVGDLSVGRLEQQLGWRRPPCR